LGDNGPLLDDSLVRGAKVVVRLGEFLRIDLLAFVGYFVYFAAVVLNLVAVVGYLLDLLHGSPCRFWMKAKIFVSTLYAWSYYIGCVT
jgi:hypothetical protein